MSVDVFGRQLIQAKEVHRGPPGVGFNLTSSEDFDIGNKLLRNVAKAESASDAVNLELLNETNDRLLKGVFSSMTEFGERLKESIKESLKEEIKTSLRGELDIDIKENTANIQHIECMIANGSEHCEKPVYSR